MEHKQQRESKQLVSRECRGEVSIYDDDDDDDERWRTPSERNYVSKETIIQQQIIEIRRLKENKTYQTDLQNKSTELQTSEEEKKRRSKKLQQLWRKKTLISKTLKLKLKK